MISWKYTTLKYFHLSKRCMVLMQTHSHTKWESMLFHKSNSQMSDEICHTEISCGHIKINMLVSLFLFSLARKQRAVSDLANIQNG